MKKAFLPLLCFLLLFGCKKHHEAVTPPQAQDSLGTGWTKIATGSTIPISDVFFVGNTGFYTSGNKIYKSVNGGDSWQKVYQSSLPFQNIGMGSADNAAFVSRLGYLIYYTTNGGASFDSTDLGSLCTDVFYVSPQVAYAISDKVWKTVNGGKNWTVIYTFPRGYMYDILYFVNEQNGWATVNGVLYKTVNGGANWTPVTNHGLVEAINFGYSLYFTDMNNGYYGNPFAIKKTTDGGANWSTAYTFTGSSYGGYHDVHFITTDIGYMTDYNLIKKTTDGGATWIREVNLVNNNALELHFTDANHGWAGTDHGVILKYTK